MAPDRYVSFGERLGYRPAFACGLEDAPTHLRNAVWNLVHPLVESWYDRATGHHPVKAFLQRMATDKHWVATHLTSQGVQLQLAFLRNFILEEAQWHEVYEVVESLPRWANQADPKTWVRGANQMLFSVGSPWRMSAQAKLVPLASQEEIAALDAASKLAGKYSLAGEHLRTASTHFSKRPDPDYDNTCKEAASAVESALLAALGVQKADFSPAIREFAEKYGVHAALKEAANKLFGYANDREGVRHAAAGKGQPVDFDEAKLVLVSASAWVNFIAAKAP